MRRRPIREYIFFQRRQYKPVLSAQNRHKFCIVIVLCFDRKTKKKERKNLWFVWNSHYLTVVFEKVRLLRKVDNYREYFQLS